jgi:hypothetical protein
LGDFLKEMVLKYSIHNLNIIQNVLINQKNQLLSFIYCNQYAPFKRIKCPDVEERQRTSVNFSGNHFFSAVTGKFTGFEGNINFDSS